VTPDRTNRVLCPVCHHSVRVTSFGTLAEHTMRLSMISPDSRCAGSGRRPPELRGGKP